MSRTIYRALVPLHWASAVWPLLLILAAPSGALLLAFLVLLFLASWGTLIVLVPRKRLLYAVAGCLLAFSALALVPFSFPNLGMAAVCGFLFLYLCRSSAFSEPDRHARTIIGGILYVIVQYAVMHADREAFMAFDGLLAPLLSGFAVFFFLVLWTVNREVMDSAASTHTLPAHVVRTNHLLVVCVYAISLLAACIPALGKALSTAYTWLRGLFGRLVSFLLSLLPVPDSAQPEASQPGGMDFSGLAEEAEPSLLAIWLERIMTVAVIILMACLALLVLRFLLIKGAAALRRLLAFLNVYMKSATEDYRDEVSDTRATGEHRQSGKRRKASPGESTDAGADAAARVRRAYRRWVRRSALPAVRYATARENLGLQAASTYEKVRYGFQSITDEEAEQFADAVNRTSPKTQGPV